MSLVTLDKPTFKRVTLVTLLATTLSTSGLDLPLVCLAARAAAQEAATQEAAAPEVAAPEAALLEEAKTAFSGGAYAASLELLRQVLEHAEDAATRTDAHFYAGCNFLLLGDGARAQKEFQEVLDLAPEYVVDPVLFPPSIVEAFQQAQQAGPTEETITVITYRDPVSRLTPSDKLPELLAGLPWYKRWWVWAVAGVVVAGGVYAASSGGDGGTKAAPLTAKTDLLTEQPPGFFCFGEQIEVGLTVSGGKPPYTIDWVEIFDPGPSQRETVVSTLTNQVEGQHTYMFQPTNQGGSGLRLFDLQGRVADQDGTSASDQERVTVATCQ
ncbi:MAG: tetratricopeptide repeat protein [Candidatus Schekmanbacteria bacterium]|nr:tetratricopeptide repeat protein [Candidatus Schekmanbacteria bacterium]